MLLSNALNDFLTIQIVKGNSSETYDTYKKRIGYFVEFCHNKKCCDLCFNDYSNYVLYLKNKNISSHTIKTRLNDVRIFIHFLERHNYTTNVFDIPSYKACKKTIVVLSEEQIIKLISSFSIDTFLGCRDLFIITLMLDCGLRVSEVLNLSVLDFNLDTNLIKVFGKGAKERLVPLTAFVSDIFQYYIDKYNIHGKLFNLTSSGVRQMFRKIKIRLGFPEFHPHFLRHTFATYFIINGGDALSLKNILGHTTFYITDLYVHIANQMVIAKKSTYSPLTVLLDNNITKKD